MNRHRCIYGLFIIMITFLLINCSKENDLSQNKSMQKSNYNQNEFEQIIDNDTRFDIEKANQALENLSVALAIALKDQELRCEIKQEALKKFDGDYEMLYSNIKNKIFKREKTLLDILAEGYLTYQYGKGNQTKKNVCREKLAQATKMIPKLNIAVPVHCEQWNTEHQLPWVTFWPCGINDSEVKELRAFDSEGVCHILDVDLTTDIPIVVLGINERTDKDGNLRSLHFTESGSMLMIDNNNYQESMLYKSKEHYSWDLIVDYFWLRDDHEPAGKGQAEIYIKVKINNIEQNHRIPDADWAVEEDDGWWNVWHYETNYWDSNIMNSEVRAKIWEDDDWPDGDDTVVSWDEWVFGGLKTFSNVGQWDGYYDIKSEKTGWDMQVRYFSQVNN